MSDPPPNSPESDSTSAATSLAGSSVDSGVSFAKDSVPPPPIKGSVTCPGCQLQISVPKETGNTQVACGSCRKVVDLRVFPKFVSPKNSEASAIEAANRISQEGDATCNFYPELKAEHICDECGCFMSEKASITWNSKTLCLPCLHTLREKKSQDEYRAGTKLYDNIALALTAPFLVVFPLWGITMITGPIALIILLRHRKSSRGIVPRSSFRWWLGVLLSAAATCVLLYFIVTWIGVLVDDITS